MKKTLSLLAFALVCLGGVAFLQRSHSQAVLAEGKTMSRKKLEQQQQATKATLDVLENTPAFGFDNLIADWSFLQFLQYFGDEQSRNRVGYDLSLDYFEIIIEHDPRFQRSYIFLSAGGTLYAGKPDRTVALMNQGLEFLTPQTPPESYYIWRYKASDELLFLGEPLTAQKSYETAAEWARLSPAPNSDQSAVKFQESADFLAANPNSRRAQINAWASVANRVADEETLQRVKRRVEQLGGTLTQAPNGNWKATLPEKD